MVRFRLMLLRSMILGFLFAFLATFCYALPALAQGGTPTDTPPPSDLRSLLIWLTSAGGAAAVVSFIASKIPAFQELEGQQKWWVMLLASAALSVVAKLLLDLLPVTVIDALTPYVTLLIGIFVAFLANQAAYGAQKAGRGARTTDTVK